MWVNFNVVDSVEDCDVDSFDELHSRITDYECEKTVDSVLGSCVDLMSSDTSTILDASPKEEIDVIVNSNDVADTSAIVVFNVAITYVTIVQFVRPVLAACPSKVFRADSFDQFHQPVISTRRRPSSSGIIL
ncbi:hypothetical protein L2E82_01733 [Cichorium intybus]|uniref:Uncharacterized protein n=1 Tax=Cichorium intybus TaxID=13427 RepID=A0ACB9H0T0_CICIN|nr:hypothetical protein L2E82_01733 [Cichorium intybus]